MLCLREMQDCPAQENNFSVRDSPAVFHRFPKRKSIVHFCREQAWTEVSLSVAIEGVNRGEPFCKMDGPAQNAGDPDLSFVGGASLFWHDCGKSQI